MAKADELAAQGTGKIETLAQDVTRYILIATLPWIQGEFGVRVPRESRNLLKSEKRLMQDAQLWRLIEEFFNKIVESGFALRDPLPDFVLDEDLARKFLGANKLTVEDVQNSVLGFRSNR